MPDPRLLPPRDDLDKATDTIAQLPTPPPTASLNPTRPQPTRRLSLVTSHSAAAFSSRLPRVLLTGFSVFPGAPLNPTEHIIPLIQSSYDSGRYSSYCSSLTTPVFPVEYASLSSRLSALTDATDPNTGPPDIIIHLGLFRGAKGITLERLARNNCAGYPDIQNQCLAGKIDDGPDTLPSTLPLGQVYSALEERGIPVYWSEDAGGYMCNYIFRLSAWKDKEKGGKGMVGFVHVPQVLEDGMGMELGVMEEAVGLVLEVCCKDWIEREGIPGRRGVTIPANRKAGFHDHCVDIDSV